jgi:hypothetical protein
MERRAIVKRSLVRIGLMSWLGGCATESRVIASPADIVRSESVPSGFVTLGTARAQCAAQPAWKQLRGEPLRNFGCTSARIRRTLAEQASIAGGTLLALESCEHDERGGRSCSATIARPAAGGAAAPVGARSGEVWDDSDAPRSEAVELIRIDLEPAAEHFARAARLAGGVAEPALLPVGHVPLGELRARCDADECGEAELRLGLRYAAGSFGATDLVAVACHALDGERSCAGTLATTEHDPTREPNAR